MAYRLNVDMWHVVNPEDQKIHRLARGDEVPSWALPEGDDLKAVTEGARIPMFVKDESDAERSSTPATPAAKASAGAQSPNDKK